MALIKCNECGHEVSDKASACPNCGCPIESLGAAQEEVIYEEPKKKKGWIWALIVALLCLIGGGGYYAYSKFDDVGSDKDAIVELTPEFIKAIEKYDELGIFSEGYAAVRKGEKWGYINAKGEEVIPVNIDAYYVGRFSEGLAFVAHGVMENAEFSVIDTEGNVVFKRSGFNWDPEFSESHQMPYFIEGKIYLPTSDYKHDVYDKHGNKLETISWEEKDSIQKISVKSSNSVFVEETNGVGEVEDYVCRKKYGVKDSVGKVLISAKYDEMAYDRDKDNTDRPFSSNGVILVVLEEPEEGHYTDGTDGTVYNPSIRHYGYVDLKGNDTFSEELKARCLKAEIKAMDNYRTYLDSLEQRKEYEEIEDYHHSPLGATNERIVTVYFKKEPYQNVTGNYGAKSDGRTADYSTKIIHVPQGKVWTLKSYRCQMLPYSEDNGFWAYIFDSNCDKTITRKQIRERYGKSYHGDDNSDFFWINWGAAYGSKYDSFVFEVNFVETDEN
ncbi:MAG: WG repeat-containing protein [Muribaculaceae bacterium]|nr:WG repeat-containing protein [Muribaculaceae bacterium]